MTVLDRIRKDPRVQEVTNEGDDGYWVYLKDGFRDGLSDTHAVHEWSLKDLRGAFKFVEPCDCSDCKAVVINNFNRLRVLADLQSDLEKLVNVCSEAL